MTLPQGIVRMPIRRWTNGHENFTVRLNPDASFAMRLRDDLPYEERYGATTANMQWLIAHAVETGTRIRALGNGWSFSPVAVCRDGLIDTKALRLAFWMHDSFVAPGYRQDGRSSADLFFCQCGMSVLELHRILQAKGRSLKACGASNGQSIVGAFSTGTHGAAYEVGAIHDSVVGLHLVTGADRHIWLERASAPVASPAFLQWLGAELVQDDEQFYAALVSFGCFGFIHGVMLETEPLFLLEEHRLDNLPYDDALRRVITALDFSGLAPRLPVPVDDPVRRLYHLELVINPHRFAEDDPRKGVYLRLLYKLPYHDDYPRRPRDDGGFMYGDDTLGVIQSVLDKMGSLSPLLVPPLVNSLFPLAFKANGPAFGTLGEIFINTRFRGKAASAATALDMADTTRAIRIIMEANKTSPFPGALGLRFVKGTRSVMGFTKFPHTCVLEMDGVDAQVSRDFFRKVWSALEAEGIPFTLHWGKLNFVLDGPLVRRMYGQAAVDAFLSARNALLDPATREVFRNDFMQQCGLDA